MKIKFKGVKIKKFNLLMLFLWSVFLIADLFGRKGVFTENCTTSSYWMAGIAFIFTIYSILRVRKSYIKRRAKK